MAGGGGKVRTEDRRRKVKNLHGKTGWRGDVMVEQVFRNPRYWPIMNRGVMMGQRSCTGERTEGLLQLLECLESPS